MLNGAPNGWRFREGGEEGAEFSANVEDDSFLEKVKSREIQFEHGTSVPAVVRTVQRKTTER